MSHWAKRSLNRHPRHRRAGGRLQLERLHHKGELGYFLRRRFVERHRVKQWCPDVELQKRDKHLILNRCYMIFSGRDLSGVRLICDLSGNLIAENIDERGQ